MLQFCQQASWEGWDQLTVSLRDGQAAWGARVTVLGCHSSFRVIRLVTGLRAHGAASWRVWWTVHGHPGFTGLLAVFAGVAVLTSYPQGLQWAADQSAVFSEESACPWGSTASTCLSPKCVHMRLPKLIHWAPWSCVCVLCSCVCGTYKINA